MQHVQFNKNSFRNLVFKQNQNVARSISFAMLLTLARKKILMEIVQRCSEHTLQNILRRSSAFLPSKWKRRTFRFAPEAISSLSLTAVLSPLLKGTQVVWNQLSSVTSVHNRNQDTFKKLDSKSLKELFRLCLANDFKFKVTSFCAVKTEQLLQNGLHPNPDPIHIFC